MFTWITHTSTQCHASIS